jgi:hypothetical protein
MKTPLLFVIGATAAAFLLPACSTNEAAIESRNTGPGAVAGPSSGWSTGSGGFSGVTRDSGSTLRGAGTSAGTNGSTGIGWIEKKTDR